MTPSFDPIPFLRAAVASHMAQHPEPPKKCVISREIAMAFVERYVGPVVACALTEKAVVRAVGFEWMVDNRLKGVCAVTSI